MVFILKIIHLFTALWSVCETFPPKNLALINHKNFVGIKF